MASFNYETGHFKERHDTAMSQTLSVGWGTFYHRGRVKTMNK